MTKDNQTRHHLRIDAVIFDLDGTLVSSELDFRAIRRQLGCPADHDLLEHIDAMPAGKAQAAHQIVLDHEMADAHGARHLPGAGELLEFLRRMALPFGVVTRNCRAAAQIKLSQMSVDHLVCREDCPPKPAPDGLLRLASGWRIHPARVLFVGDYLYDLEAAENAGMPSCLINAGIEAPYQGRADIVVQDLPELLDHLHLCTSAR